jgi:hypothetical protein
MEFCERPEGNATDNFQGYEEEATTISPAVSSDALVSEVMDENCPLEDSEFNEESADDLDITETILPEAICSGDIDVPLSEGTPMLLDDSFGSLDRSTFFSEGSRNVSFLNLTAASSVALVTPIASSRNSVLDRSKFEMADAPTLDLLDSFFESQQEGIHSGDQLSFMGLPFHYLESKDVMETLNHD